ncbi:SPS-sensor component ptr3 [Rhizina undulata]
MATVPASEPTDLVDIYSDDDSEENYNNHVLREDLVEKEEVMGPVQPDPIPPAPAYLDLNVTVKELLWMLPGINEIVRSVLTRMEMAFAYNSVYFLKIILELQAVYVSSKLGPPPSAMLDVQLVLKIAETMAGRMGRREKEGTSQSKELQLRTLISALSLLNQLDIGTLDKETFAKLFKDISERDAENQAKPNKEKGGIFCNGDNKFLVRYAYDLIRCMPNEFPVFPELNSEAVYYIFAAGFINQLEDQTDRPTLEGLFSRITAPQSKWHKDMREVYEDAIGVICSHHLAQSRYATPASQFAKRLIDEIVNAIVEKVATFIYSRPIPDTQLQVCGLLDLINQLVAAFPQSDSVVGKARQVALELIRDSDKREYRYKAFEIFISSTAGGSEAEYYDMMRALDLEIENTARSRGSFDTRSEGEKLRALERVDKLKREKREAMDRCDYKAILFKGAVESMQRRLQGGLSPARISRRNEESLRLKVPWSDEARSVITASPVPSSLPSQVPTLSSKAPTCDSAPSPTATPTCESIPSHATTLLSPTNSTTCKSVPSPTDTCHTLLSPYSRDYTPLESPILPNLSATNTSPYFPHYQTRLLQEPITPNEDTFLRFNDLGQLFSDARLSLFDEPEEYDLPLDQANTRKMSINLPIQSFDASDDDQEEIPVLMHISELQNIDSASNYRRKPSRELQRSSIGNHIIIEPPEPSPKSIYPEPSLSRTPSGQTQAGSLKRQSRASKIFSGHPGYSKNRHSRLFLHKSLQLMTHPKESMAEEDAPEPLTPNAPAQLAVFEPMRSQSAMEMRNEKMDLLRMYNSSSSLGICNTDHPALQPSFPPIVVEDIPSQTSSKVDYESQPIEETFKITPKDSSFNVFLSSDAKYAIYLAPHAFQVFVIPSPGESMSQKVRFHHRMGSMEGRRKIKFTPSQSYKFGAASERYVVTGTKEQIQVYDLHQECKVVFEDTMKGWELTCAAISSDKLVISLSKVSTDGSLAIIRIYKMNAPSYTGHRCEILREFYLPTLNRQTDAPHILTLSRDGNYLTCGTRRHGYYFAWDLSRIGMTPEPRLISSGKLTVSEGPDAEFLTGAAVFPNGRHIFCTTYPINTTKSDWGPRWAGHFTEPTALSSSTHNHRKMRQISMRVAASVIAPAGNACAFLTKHGTAWVTPIAHYEGDQNLTTFIPSFSKEKMHYPQAPCPETPKNTGCIQFTPSGDQLVAVDKKGKIMVLTFRKQEYPPIQHRKEDHWGYW